MRLLLATAQPDLRLSLELLLGEQPGVKIVGTVSESDGLLALIHTTTPDMIVTDWDLPGRPLTAIFNETNLPKPPKIIILINRISDTQRAQETCADAVVLKGASPDILLKTFQQVRKQPNKSKGDSV